MNEMVFETGESITIEQKRVALDLVLHSLTFARADQLKSFLRYVCEMEFTGRGHELTEYLIGVEALGRPDNYSPGDDSAVRNRAFALRKKLHEFYEHEQPETPIRIELTKGSYCPHFIVIQSHEKSNGNGILAPRVNLLSAPLLAMDEGLISAEGEKNIEKKRMLFAFITGVVSTAIIAGAIYLLTGAKQVSNSTRSDIAPILAEAWGPILGPNADVLISVANPPSFSVHPPGSPTPSPIQFGDPGIRPMPPELDDWYRKTFPTPADYNLFLTITKNATYWGDSVGAITAQRAMFSAGVSPQIFPEKVITVPTLRRRNVVLLGAPEYSPAVAHFLEKCPLTVNYLSAIVSQEPGKMPASIYSTVRDQKNRLAEVFGLITVMPSESSTNNQNRTVIFSGINSAGTQAAAEFFTSPENLIELKKQLKKDGYDTFPPAYQVVVRSKTDDSILINFKYETYRIIPMLSSGN